VVPAVVAAVVALGLGAWWLAAGDDGGGSADGRAGDPAGARPPPPPASSVPLDAEGQTLADLLASGRDATYHATYGASTSSGGYTLEVFRHDGNVRQDSVTETPRGTFRTAGLLVGGDTIICHQQPGAEWVCSESVGADDGVADGVFGTIVDALGAVDVAVTEETVDGRAVRCFAYEVETGPGSMCLRDDGVPVRVVAGDTELVLTSIDEDVPESVFQPPAAPVQARTQR
jgi:hypothetical protein